MNKVLTCISCPYGCSIEARIDETSGEIIVTGNRCNAGKLYAISELNKPVRTVTTTLPLKAGIFMQVPVKTNKPIDKNLIPQLMKTLATLELSPPIQVGDIIVKNILNTGVDIVATAHVDGGLSDRN